MNGTHGITARWLQRTKLASVTAMSLAIASQTHATDVGGPILADTTWDAGGSPYTVVATILIGADAVLTINPGVEIRVDPGLGIGVGSQAFGPGTLVARGTAEEPIIFTSNLSDPDVPAAGDWKDILFSDFAVDAEYDGDGSYLSGSALEHCVIEFAGSGDIATGSITIQSSSPYLSDCEVRHSARSGIRADMAVAPPLKVLNCEMWDCAGNSQNGGALDRIVSHTHLSAEGRAAVGRSALHAPVERDKLLRPPRRRECRADFLLPQGRTRRLEDDPTLDDGFLAHLDPKRQALV